MILYTGGKAQGTEEAAKARFKADAKIIEGLEEQIRDYLTGHAVHFDEIPKLAEDWAKEVMTEEERSGTLILITREMGCGVIPMDEAELLLRELYGRFQVELAKRAERVFRVFCGIEYRIK